MLLAALIAAALLAWAWKTGRLGRVGRGQLLCTIALAAGLLMAAKGRPQIGLPVAVLAGYGLWRGRQAVPAPVAAMDEAEALRLLDLPPGADAEAVRAAHRRVIARVHPDAGGSAALAHQVNAARDLLIGRMNRSGPHAS